MYHNDKSTTSNNPVNNPPVVSQILIENTKELLSDNPGVLSRSHISLLDSTPVEPTQTEDRPNPPNGGWGWAVVVGCFITHILLGGFVRSFGIIYVELMSQFNGTAAATSAVGGLCTAVRMFGGPLASVLSTAFGVRPVVIVGGLLTALGSCISAFATSTEFLFFSYSLVCGFGGALVYTPSITIVGQYFTSRRGIALGISVAGSGVGVFIFPPLLHFLFRQFGYFGAFVLLSSIVLNFVVCGSLYRPLHLSYTKEQRQQLRQNHTDKCSSPTPPPTKPALHLRVWSYCKQCLHNFWSYLNLKLLSSGPFCLFVVAYSFVTFSYIGTQNLLVAHAQMNGIPQTEAVLLLSIIGVTDVIGRVASGFCYDIGVIRQRRGYFLCLIMFLTSLTILLWGLLSSFISMAIVSALCGAITGAIVTGRPVIVVDIVGVENLSSSFGLTVCFQGIALMLGPLLAGYLKDVTGDYKASFYFAAACCLFGTLMMLSSFILRRRLQATTKSSL